jgi:DNA-binding MarR family transcriptional regulator
VADQWSRDIVLALADKPLQPSELEARLRISRSTLYARIADLKAMGMLTARTRTTYPLRIEYDASVVGRVVFATALLAERRQCSLLAGRIDESACHIDEVLRVLMPLVRVRSSMTATCVLEERSADGTLASDGFDLREERLFRRPTPSRGTADVRMLGGADAWTAALTTGDTGGVQISGDRDLGRLILRALIDVLLPPS